MFRREQAPIITKEDPKEQVQKLLIEQASQKQQIDNAESKIKELKQALFLQKQEFQQQLNALQKNVSELVEILKTSNPEAVEQKPLIAEFSESVKLYIQSMEEHFSVIKQFLIADSSGKNVVQELLQSIILCSNDLNSLRKSGIKTLYTQAVSHHSKDAKRILSTTMDHFSQQNSLAKNAAQYIFETQGSADQMDRFIHSGVFNALKKIGVLVTCVQNGEALTNFRDTFNNLIRIQAVSCRPADDEIKTGDNDAQWKVSRVVDLPVTYKNPFSESKEVLHTGRIEFSKKFT